MEPSISEDEAVRKMKKIRGFVLDEDGFGYKVSSPKGTIWFRGTRLTDEGFESETFGTLNISEMYRKIGTWPEQLPTIEIAAAVANTARIEINAAYAKRLPKSRLRDPVLVVFAVDGWHVIDGAHRIYQLHRLRKANVSALFVIPELLAATRVRRYLQSQDGTWSDDDTVPQHRFESALAGSREYMAKLKV